MTRLKSKLLSLNKNKPENLKNKIFSPANCEELRIPIRTEKIAKVVGKLAEQFALPTRHHDGAKEDENEKRVKSEEEGQVISGVLVQNDLKLSLMDPDDLREYAGLTTTTIMCRQKITLAAAGVELIRWALEGTFGGIKDLTPKKMENGATHAHTNGDGANVNGEPVKQEALEQEEADEEVDRQQYEFLVMDTVTVLYRNQGEIEVEWEGNMMNDGIADAVMAVLLTVESSPAAVKRK